MASFLIKIKSLIFLALTATNAATLARPYINLTNKLYPSALIWQSLTSKQFGDYSKYFIDTSKQKYANNQYLSFGVENIEKNIYNLSVFQDFNYAKRPPDRKSIWPAANIESKSSANYQEGYSKIDNTGIYISYFIPGGGLIYEGQIKKGLISLSINAVLIYAIIQSIIDSKYGLALFFTFLEVPFYKGNINATREHIQNKNKLNTELKTSLLFEEKKKLISFNYDF